MGDGHEIFAPESLCDRELEFGEDAAGDVVLFHSFYIIHFVVGEMAGEIAFLEEGPLRFGRGDAEEADVYQFFKCIVSDGVVGPGHAEDVDHAGGAGVAVEGEGAGDMDGVGDVEDGGAADLVVLQEGPGEFGVFGD